MGRFFSNLFSNIVTIVVLIVLGLLTLQIAPNFWPELFGKEEPQSLVEIPLSTPTVDAVAWVVGELTESFTFMTATAPVCAGGIATAKQGAADLEVGVVISGTLQMGTDLQGLGKRNIQMAGTTLVVYLPEIPRVLEFVYLGDHTVRANKTIGQAITPWEDDARHLRPGLEHIARCCAILKVRQDTGIAVPGSLIEQGCPADARGLEMVEYGADERMRGLAEALEFARSETRQQLAGFICALAADDRAAWQSVKIVFPLENTDDITAIQCGGGDGDVSFSAQ